MRALCSSVNRPPTLINRTSGNSRRTLANVSINTSMRLRAIFDPTCSNSGASTPVRPISRSASAAALRGRGLACELFRNRKRHYAEFLRRQKPVPQDLGACCLAVASNPRCLLQARKRLLHERPKPRRPRLALGFDHAPKRIQIMTRRHSPARRHDVQRLRVTVIRKMIKVECARGDDLLDVSGIFEIPIDHPIQVSRRMSATYAR